MILVNGVNATRECYGDVRPHADLPDELFDPAGFATRRWAEEIYGKFAWSSCVSIIGERRSRTRLTGMRSSTRFRHPGCTVYLNDAPEAWLRATDVHSPAGWRAFGGLPPAPAPRGERKHVCMTRSLRKDVQDGVSPVR